MSDAIRLSFFFATGILLACAGSAPALVVLGDDAARSSAAPPFLVGWQLVGSRASLSAIYIGNGWVLTAQHVPPGYVNFGGVQYTAVPESAIRLKDPEGGKSQPDLAVFRIHPAPDLGEVEIRKTAAEVGEIIILVGCGLDRGPSRTWNGIAGFSVGEKRTKRWGTNRIDQAGRDYSSPFASTRGFSMSFDPFDTRFEAQVANGDSGGAVFTKSGNRWVLSGVLFSMAMFPDQPEGSSLYGNRSFAVDLSHYRDQLLALIRGEGEAMQQGPGASREGVDTED